MHGQLFGMIDHRVLTRWINDKAFRQEVCNFMDAIATAEVPEEVLRMSKQLPNPVPVGCQPYPSAEDVPMDSAYCRLRLMLYAPSLFYMLDGRMPYVSHVIPKTVCLKEIFC